MSFANFRRSYDKTSVKFVMLWSTVVYLRMKDQTRELENRTMEFLKNYPPSKDVPLTAMSGPCMETTAYGTGTMTEQLFLTDDKELTRSVVISVDTIGPSGGGD